MKTYLKTLIVAAVLTLSTSILLAQGPPPPPPPGGHGSGGHEPPFGGTSPIEGGLGILIALGVAYGAGKTYFMRKKETK